MSGQWIKWDGGECPVHPDTGVEIKLRDGSVGTEFARSVVWVHRRLNAAPYRGDVVAYRVGSPAVVSTPGVPAPAPNDENWIEWDPSGKFDLPVQLGGDDIVSVKHRDGSISSGAVRLFRWGLDPRGFVATDIVAYRFIRSAGGSHAGLIAAIKTSTVAQQMGEVFGKPSPHAHYFKSVAHLDTIDVYRVLSLFSVTDPCLQHAIKKLLVAGGRGAGKDIGRDVQEAIDSLVRWQAMRQEDEAAK